MTANAQPQTPSPEFNKLSRNAQNLLNELQNGDDYDTKDEGIHHSIVKALVDAGYADMVDDETRTICITEEGLNILRVAGLLDPENDPEWDDFDEEEESDEDDSELEADLTDGDGAFGIGEQEIEMSVDLGADDVTAIIESEVRLQSQGKRPIDIPTRPADVQPILDKKTGRFVNPTPAPKADAKPKKERTPRPAPQPKDCTCGCGGKTRGGDFIMGHDAKLKSMMLKVRRGEVKLEDVAEIARYSGFMMKWFPEYHLTK